MKYADKLTEIMNAFSPEPLRMEQMQDYYCDETMEFRMSDKYCSPIADISDACQNPMDHSAFLLLGHKGCGKSTELNRMSAELTSKGYYIKTIMCSMDLDMFNIVYSDLFILMGEALLQIAEESGCQLEESVLEDISTFWAEVTEVAVSQESSVLSIETGVSMQTPRILKKVLKVFANIKADLKFNEETRKEYRRKISVRSSEWIHLLNLVANGIMNKSEGNHKPIIIFEDLDKLNPEDAWDVFYNYAAILSGVNFPVIYTFPIGLSYDPRFSALEGYFITKTLPMIKIETIEGDAHQEGIEVIKKIIEKRSKLDLFDEKVLENLIKYTGGSLRDLFHAINTAAKRAVRRNSNIISTEDAERALEELKTSLTRRIEQNDYEFLLNIYKGNKELIENKEMLLKMLQASVVLEYNGKRWHNVHPLVVQFFKEQGLIEDGRE